ncbi:sodium/potassium/calcium exchanger 1-like isoform X4 [Acropora muricata]|uniref:sodium/potassium/calcium exchanger 1-like isoform X4 n=1 Tax=Acropora muricata TaxID=159855 RepID=UPI0034E5FE03
MKLQSLVLCLVLGLTLVLQCSEGKSTYISLLGHDMQGENDESTVEAGEGHANERRQYIPPPEFGRKKEVAFKAGEAGEADEAGEAGEGHANERRQHIPPPEFGRKKEVAFKAGEAGEGHANERRQHIPPPEFGRKKEVAFKAGEADEAGEGHANERRQYIPPPEFGRKKEVAFKEIPAWLRHSEPLRQLRSDE